MLSNKLPVLPSNSNSNNQITENIYTVHTQLREIYGKEKKDYIEEKLEPIYESMRTKFRNSFDNTEPSFFIRVPYAQILLGDNITHLFEEKLITTLEKDLIICGNIISEKKVFLELFDKYSPKIKFDLEDEPQISTENEIINTDYIHEIEHTKYIISAFKAGIKNSKPKIKKGANLLINFNIPNNSSKDCLISTFIATFFASLYIHDGIKLFSKQTLFELCFNELNRIDNFTYYSGVIYFQMYLERNSIGIQNGNEFRQIKVDCDDGMMICDSFSSTPPMAISMINFWNKRKVEFKLALALILKRYKKNFTNEEILEIAKDFKSFAKYFENNLETIFELIE
jgi:hypothetical protein